MSLLKPFSNREEIIPVDKPTSVLPPEGFWDGNPPAAFENKQEVTAIEEVTPIEEEPVAVIKSDNIGYVSDGKKGYGIDVQTHTIQSRVSLGIDDINNEVQGCACNPPCEECTCEKSYSPYTSAVHHPPHYQGSDPELEVINVIELYDLNFSLGNAYKYILRAENKNQIQDLEKASWYLNRERGNRGEDSLYKKLNASTERPVAFDIANAFNLSYNLGSAIASILEYRLNQDIDSICLAIKCVGTEIERLSK